MKIGQTPIVHPSASSNEPARRSGQTSPDSYETARPRLSAGYKQLLDQVSARIKRRRGLAARNQRLDQLNSLGGPVSVQVVNGRRIRVQDAGGFLKVDGSEERQIRFTWPARLQPPAAVLEALAQRPVGSLFQPGRQPGETFSSAEGAAWQLSARAEEGPLTPLEAHLLNQWTEDGTLDRARQVLNERLGRHNAQHRGRMFSSPIDRVNPSAVGNRLPDSHIEPLTGGSDVAGNVYYY